jgi:hypothetical protein
LAAAAAVGGVLASALDCENENAIYGNYHISKALL